ncbi:MAG: ribosome biogenesis GTPase Der [Magnetococcales bacterium]|nr:ribosome biogenesis GTPase Der [Magnetococcales bacterium]
MSPPSPLTLASDTVLPLIALVGRPNVGKSSLFNRLTRSRQALVDDKPGVTRDRQYGSGVWGKRKFRLVDTGGFQAGPEEPLAAQVTEQVMVALEEADGVVFVTDGQAGPLPEDRHIANMLRRFGKPLVLAVNKSDSREGREGRFAFHELGIHPLLPISAAHGHGMDDLIDALSPVWPEEIEAGGESDKAEDQSLRVAVVGRPNVGKSTLVNQLLGENRQLASDIPGTTRDSVDMVLERPDGGQVILVDTAGIRAKRRISQRLEKFSAIAALKAIDRAELAILVLDAPRGITDQDQKVAGYAIEAGCGVVVAVNKWDAMPRGKEARRLFLEELRRAFPHFPHVPVRFLSAKSGSGVNPLLPTAEKVWKGCRLRISTGQLNRWLREAVEKHAPPRSGGRSVKIRFATQVAVSPPTFILFTNRPDGVNLTYRRYLENQLREQFPFAGVPLRIFFRKRENPFVDEKGKGA